MKGKQSFVIGLAMTLILILVPGLALAQEPTGSPLPAAFTYQGQLKSNNIPYNGLCDFQFGLWDAFSGGTQVGPTQTVTNVGVAEGYFTVMLDFGPDKFQGEARWLEIFVRCPAGAGNYTPLTPRQMLTATPYAVYSMFAPWSGLIGVPPGFADGIDNNTIYNAGAGVIITGTTILADTNYLQQRVTGTCGSGFAIRVVNKEGSVECEPVSDGGGNTWLLTGNFGTTPGVNYVGTNDNAALVFKVNGERALRLEPNGVSPNVIGGYISNWAYSGVNGAVIGGGGNSTYANIVTDSYGTIGGGMGNQAGDDAGSTTDATYATVSGGRINTAEGSSATVSGGTNNIASGSESTVGGGGGNTASSNYATISGGDGNTVNSDYASISGGISNDASGYAACISGGTLNEASGDWAFIGGGYANNANYDSATVGGGGYNTASGDHATLGGGFTNIASGDYSTLGGGTNNNATGLRATVSGGYSNTASGSESTVGGGQENTASGIASTVPGGVLNVAQGNYSFAAGSHAHATTNGSFVWNDNSGLDGYDYGANTFTVRASNGTWILADNVGDQGLLVNNTSGMAIYANTTSNNVAVEVNNSGTGMGFYAHNNSDVYPAGLFHGFILVSGGCQGCLLIQAGLNGSSEVLQPGDLAAISGLAEPLAGSSQPVLIVHRAAAGEAVIGVVQVRGVRNESTVHNGTLEIIGRAEGDVQPGDYLLLVVYGPTLVKADASSGAIAVGAQLTSSGQQGYARVIQTRTIDGMVIAEAAPGVGIALEALDSGKGLISVFVTLH